MYTDLLFGAADFPRDLSVCLTLGEPPQELSFRGGLLVSYCARRERAPHDPAANQGRASRCENARRDLEAEANRSDADAFAESLRPIVAPLIHLSSRRIAKVLNDRGIKSPTGKAWQSVTVLRLVERLKGESRP